MKYSGRFSRSVGFQRAHVLRTGRSGFLCHHHHHQQQRQHNKQQHALLVENLDIDNDRRVSVYLDTSWCFIGEAKEQTLAAKGNLAKIQSVSAQEPRTTSTTITAVVSLERHHHHTYVEFFLNASFHNKQVSFLSSHGLPCFRRTTGFGVLLQA